MDYVVLRKKKKNHVAILICCVYAIALIILYMLDGFYTPLYKLDSVVIKSISIAMISCVVFLIITCMMCLLHFMSSEEGAMEKQAQFDALTELPNRFYMMAKLKNLFEAEKQGEYFLAMIDIDDFKKINDSFGHNVGDDALKMLARTIVNKARGVELSYCRWGGEEFLLLGKCVDGEVPKNFLDELRVEINSKSFWTSKGSGRMTVTIGAGKYKVGQDYKEWINFVDKQLYVGKCTGKARGVELSYCRWGGEEFLLLGKCVDGEVPKNFLDELRVEINSKSFWTSKGSGRMTVTIGAGKYKVGQDYKEWINFVDKQLYVGKCTGKNKVVC
jgi:diguanylate cyclase (GGDEF)-like protein